MSGSDDEKNGSAFVQSFGRHLVALCVTFREKVSLDPLPSFRAFACTLLHIDGRNFLLTADHILSELHEALKSEKVEILSAVLQDNFGAERICDLPIPFDLKSAEMFFIDDAEEGLDFGVIALRPYYVNLLAANKMVALAEENWVREHVVQFDLHLMLRLPAEYTSDHASATMFAVKRLNEPPDGIPTTRYPRFVGELDPDRALASVRKMSGGPILGFNLTPPIRCWVVALQSTWLRDRRLVFGCPLPELASLMTGRWRDRLCEVENKGNRYGWA
ncbi:hypothetical protein ACVINW_003855 [Bradyrhizobium sp. USDA 4461]